MRLGIPHLGNVYIPFTGLMDDLGIDCVVPPLNTPHTLSLGVKNSPEGVCIPYKIMLGNLIEAAEMGADVLFQVAGDARCRLGYYARSQEEVLKGLGYNARVINLNLEQGKIREVIKLVKDLTGGASLAKILASLTFAYNKLVVLDDMEKLAWKARAAEQVRGSANRVYARSLEALGKADSYSGLNRMKREFTEEFESLPRRPGYEPLVVGIVGEFYVLIEPFSNLDMENELGKLGVEVRRHITTSEWIRQNILFPMVHLDAAAEIHRAAWPYLKRHIDGDGRESVGEKALHARDWDGLIHAGPFT